MRVQPSQFVGLLATAFRIILQCEQLCGIWMRIVDCGGFNVLSAFAQAATFFARYVTATSASLTFAFHNFVFSAFFAVK